MDPGITTPKLITAKTTPCTVGMPLKQLDLLNQENDRSQPVWSARVLSPLPGGGGSAHVERSENGRRGGAIPYGDPFRNGEINHTSTPLALRAIDPPPPGEGLRSLRLGDLWRLG